MLETYRGYVIRIELLATRLVRVRWCDRHGHHGLANMDGAKWSEAALVEYAKRQVDADYERAAESLLAEVVY